jgi:quaternary ammonium compound-resistance protein SugE
MNSWLILIVAAIFEIVWAVGLKSTHGFTKLWPSVGVIAAMATSMWLLALAARGLPIGTAYAVWTGIGAVGTTIASILWFNESASAMRLICIVLIIAGITGLKFFEK